MMHPFRRAALFMLALLPTTVLSADLENYRLTDKALGQFEKATEAMYQFARENPALANTLDDEDDEDVELSIDETARELDRKAPGLRGKVESSGMKLEEYFTFSMVLAANAFGAAMADHFGKEDDTKLTDVQRANIAFFRRNQQRVEEFNARMQRQYPDVMDNGQDAEDDYAEDENYEDEYQDEYSEEDTQ